MEWFWLLITLAILFLFLVGYRLAFIRGYKAGARKVIAEWKETLYQEDDVDVSEETY